MKFSETIKFTAPDLVVSRRHEEWLVANDHPVYSLHARRFAARQLDSLDRVRTGTVSASALGGCLRAQQFTYLGMPQSPHSTQSLMRMHNGSFMHLRWQMAGLSEGWLVRAEVPVPDNPFQLSGTMDGLLYDESVFELKSINANGFRRVMTFGPLLPHLLQMASYMLCSQREKGVFVYECKDNQEYTEVVLRADQLPLREARDQAQSLWAAIEGKSLFEPLDKCIDRTGWEYGSCPYREQCLAIHEWEEVDVGAH